MPQNGFDASTSSGHSKDPHTVEEYFKLGYRGARYSFGYGAAQI